MRALRYGISYWMSMWCLTRLVRDVRRSRSGPTDRPSCTVCWVPNSSSFSVPTFKRNYFTRTWRDVVTSFCDLIVVLKKSSKYRYLQRWTSQRPLLHKWALMMYLQFRNSRLLQRLAVNSPLQLQQQHLLTREYKSHFKLLKVAELKLIIISQSSSRIGVCQALLLYPNDPTFCLELKYRNVLIELSITIISIITSMLMLNKINYLNFISTNIVLIANVVVVVVQWSAYYSCTQTNRVEIPLESTVFEKHKKCKCSQELVL